MRVGFAGTPEFARTALAALHAAGFEVPLVLSQPDRPAGRGMKLQASPVKQWALEHAVAVAQPHSLRLDGKYPDEAAAARQALLDARLDVLVVAAYGLILPQWVLDLPRLGCMNIHASLLPRWRGAAPIHRAIEAGDAETGVTIMQMDAGLDTGDMLVTEHLAIAPSDTTATLHDRLAALGGRLMVETLEMAACGGLTRIPQPADGVTYAHKIEKAESTVNWADSPATIARRARAFDPFPGASTTWRGDTLKIWGARLHADNESSIDSNVLTPTKREGTVLLANESGIAVQTGEGVLVLTHLQRAGGKRLAAADFLRGCPVAVGDVLGDVQGGALGGALADTPGGQS
ncbi:MAG: methionyl-tRNA formyltransferase [Burkholderiales bacterium]|nr:methionyl-tRNA formyltransferase [Burkholderiales bacterium]